LRLQRIQFAQSLRRSRRDQILEDRRQVLRKINWTTGWDDIDDIISEEELNSLSCSFEDLIHDVINSWLTNKTPSFQSLNYLRRLLDREMKGKFGDISTIWSNETPGV